MLMANCWLRLALSTVGTSCSTWRSMLRNPSATSALTSEKQSPVQHREPLGDRKALGQREIMQLQGLWSRTVTLPNRGWSTMNESGRRGPSRRFAVAAGRALVVKMWWVVCNPCSRSVGQLPAAARLATTGWHPNSRNIVSGTW
jgi:hypothetical protein